MIARRRLAALVAGLSLVLAGCGWTPIYADPQTDVVDAELRTIRVYPILDRAGQRLETELRRALNPENLPSEKRYLLRVSMQTIRQNLGVQSQGLGTRGEVQNIANMTLVDVKTGANLVSATIHVNDSFDIQANGYSTEVAVDDAKVRTIAELRDEIITRLTLFLQRRRAEAKT